MWTGSDNVIGGNIMIYTPLTVKAMQTAYEAHLGQYDKCGVPYILHPVHLAEQMNDEYTVCAALLHDVAEDTDIALEQLAEHFPAPVIEALRLLTHEDGTDYFTYVRRLKDNDIARAVKLADLAHNSDPARAALTGEPEEKTAARLAKYAEAKRILLDK